MQGCTAKHTGRLRLSQWRQYFIRACRYRSVFGRIDSGDERPFCRRNIYVDLLRVGGRGVFASVLGKPKSQWRLWNGKRGCRLGSADFWSVRRWFERNRCGRHGSLDLGLQRGEWWIKYVCKCLYCTKSKHKWGVRRSIRSFGCCLGTNDYDDSIPNTCSNWIWKLGQSYKIRSKRYSKSEWNHTPACG